LSLHNTKTQWEKLKKEQQLPEKKGRDKHQSHQQDWNLQSAQPLGLANSLNTALKECLVVALQNVCSYS
jgi:hypothetical protein